MFKFDDPSSTSHRNKSKCMLLLLQLAVNMTYKLSLYLVL